MSIENAEPRIRKAQEEAHNEELAKLNDRNVSVLVEQKKVNQRRTELVANTLQAQYSRVESEAKRLAFVKGELSKLDKSLSTNSSSCSLFERKEKKRKERVDWLRSCCFV
jgi:tRNA C32,U32 (ribose-2'-O)-methylase TrmJ